jgi:hypothetical protein
VLNSSPQIALCNDFALLSGEERISDPHSTRSRNIYYYPRDGQAGLAHGDHITSGLNDLRVHEGLRLPQATASWIDDNYPLENSDLDSRQSRSSRSIHCVTHISDEPVYALVVS